jgi:Coenzyme PQQ synthesis protein D (PqqD)
VSAAISFSSRVVIPDTVLFREFDGEAVILNLDTESYLGLDDVGTRMWMLLANQPSIQAAYDVLLTEYDVSPETLRADMAHLLGQMLEHKLITLKDE